MGGSSSKVPATRPDGRPEQQDPSLPSTVMETVQNLKIHKVSSVERKQSTLFSLSAQGLITHFSPLRRGKSDQSFRSRLLLVLQYLFPILDWAPQYNLQFLKSDICSGIAIATLAIPQGISCAKLANLPPIMGLYTNFVPPLIYAVLGNSRELSVGPSSILSLVLGSILSEVLSPEIQPTLYLQVALTATFFAGLFQASLGLLRLGFVMDYLSKPTLMGFMHGAAIITVMEQLKNLLGLIHFTKKTGLVGILGSIYDNRGEFSGETLAMGLLILVFLMIATKLSSKRPHLFWVGVVAPIASLILSTIFVFSTKAHTRGIKIIGHTEEGINPPSLKMLIFKGPYTAQAVKIGVATGILGLTDVIAQGRTFASFRNYQINENKEIRGVGVMNVIGSCFSCFVASGSLSRTTLNHSTGSKTTVSNIVMASILLVMMRFLMPLIHYTPNVNFAAIIIMAVIKIIDFKAASRLWKVDKLDFITYLSAFFGVTFLTVQTGLIIAVGISIFKILMHVTRPNIVMMGNVPGTQSYRNLEQYEDAKRVSSFLILGVESPIYFANSTYFKLRILRWVKEEEERAISNVECGIKCVVLDMSTVTAIDTTGIEALLQLQKTLKKRSLELVLVNPVGDVAVKLRASEAWKIFGSKRIYMRIDEAIAAISWLLNGMPSKATFNKKSWIIYDNEIAI
ncbi:putative sulfate transporter 3.4 [Platanthera guangdongensis]|uniref:Sulfate transporter 3.4 n=1 Tax=Platanthera guangdongensis TaxID=2320717 RepID=A0ABR2LHH8_9ASPA